MDPREEEILLNVACGLDPLTAVVAAADDPEPPKPSGCLLLVLTLLVTTASWIASTSTTESSKARITTSGSQEHGNHDYGNNVQKNREDGNDGSRRCRPRQQCPQESKLHGDDNNGPCRP